jgi:group I intron endonuclease
MDALISLNKPGIYAIENILNHNIYIGQASNIRKRKNLHFHKLAKNKHENSHLQNSFKKYGEKNFIFKILLYCEIPELTYYEQSIVNTFNPNSLYNIRLECVNSPVGTKFSEERRNKARESSKGNKNMLGKHHSEESKRKMSESRKGKVFSKEHRENMGKAKKGIHSGKNNPMYGKTGKENPFYGKNHSQETIKMISQAKKEYWKKRKEGV